MADQVPSTPLPRRTVLLDLAPLWLSIAAAGVVLAMRFSVWRGRNWSDALGWMFACSAFVPTVTGTWLIWRIGPLVGRLTQPAFREELALTALTPQTIFNGRLWPRLRLLRSPFATVGLIALIGFAVYLGYGALWYDPNPRLGQLSEPAMMSGLCVWYLASAYIVSIWAPADLLARLCRGNWSSTRRFWVQAGWTLFLWGGPWILFPGTVWLATILADVSSPKRWIAGGACLAALAAMLLVVGRIMGWKARKDYVRAGWPAEIAALTLAAVLGYPVAAMLFRSNFFIGGLLASLNIFWLAFTIVIARAARRRWRTAAERYFVFE